MNVLIAGGTGFLGHHLARSLLADRHRVWVLTRGHRESPTDVTSLSWDGRTLGEWARVMNEMDAVVNLAGLSLNSWPWTEGRKRRFHDSRVGPGHALVSAVEQASRRPGVFIQVSGINHYGLRGEGIADETCPPGEDYLSQLTVAWEGSTASIKALGVRHVVCRTAVVLARDATLFLLMALPVRLFVGGPLGSGGQALPWIHLQDWISATRFLMDHPEAEGAYNLIAPAPTSNAEFMRGLAKAYRRPYWFRVPVALLRLVLGEMSVLVTEGRFSEPRRLNGMGFQFRFPDLESAFENLVSKNH